MKSLGEADFSRLRGRVGEGAPRAPTAMIPLSRYRMWLNNLAPESADPKQSQLALEEPPP
jgi:hypothetical protein